MRADWYMSMQKNLKVSILGKNYCVSTDENEADIINAAELIDQLMKSKIEKKSMPEENVALIVALQLATDLAKNQRVLQQHERETSQLIALLEQAL